jgi:hypothetical protein
MNIIKKDDILYFYESYWRLLKNDNSDRDSFGKLFPYPQGNIKKWSGQDQFLEQLSNKEKNIKLLETNRNKNCLLCNKKNINKGKYNDAEFIWEDGLKHYIEIHNIKPTDEFIEFVYLYKLITNKNQLNKRIIKFDSDIYVVHDIQHIKITRNQIMIMDALMRHGGYTKKYIDKKHKSIFRYSEHSGLLDFNKNGLDKIIISGKTERVDRGDEEIYLPKNIPDAFDYEYIFHTHPPTPKPGGRADVGILYDFPSISDIFHFIDHFNEGMTQGSLVLASEGMYNIRKKKFDRKKIKIDEDGMFIELQNLYPDIQEEAINKYGIEFNTKYFYEEISQNDLYINKINHVLNKYNIHIDYFPRSKDETGKWIITDLFLPIYITEQQKKI